MAQADSKGQVKVGGQTVTVQSGNAVAKPVVVDPVQPALPQALTEEEKKRRDRRPQLTKVQAIATGYYNDARRRVGDVFHINHPDDFSERWMQRVDADTPEKITTGQQELSKANQEQLAARRGGAAVGTVGGPGPTGAGNPLGVE